jgi:hypothetical protein
VSRKELFLKNLEDFKRNIHWLVRSLEKAKEIDISSLEEEDIEKIEVLFSRFSRSVDMLINRILRGIDLLELEDGGTKLDVVIRAEKRGFVESYEELIALKDLRNELAHEYIGERFVDKLSEVLESSEKIIEIADRVMDYIYNQLLPKIRSHNEQ